MHRFDQDVSLERKETFVFCAKITENWSISGNPNGGYLMALLTNAMLQGSERSHTPILTANYLSRCAPGEATITVEEFSRSRQFVRFMAKLVQKGAEKVRMIGTFSDGHRKHTLKRYEATPPMIPPPEKCFPVPEMGRYTLFRNMDVRLDPGCAGWMAGRLTDRSEHRGWVTFRETHPFDLLSIPLAADSFPPAVFPHLGAAAWVPTIEFSVNIRRVPAATRLKCRFRTRFISHGIMEEDGEIWDEAGDLIAISRQIAQLGRGGG